MLYRLHETIFAFLSFAHWTLQKLHRDHRERVSQFKKEFIFAIKQSKREHFSKWNDFVL